MIETVSAYAATLRQSFSAPFWLHTRYMLKTYWQDSFLITSAVLAVALSMDLSHYLGEVLAADHSGTILGTMFYLGWYIELRSADQIAEFLPLVSFLGVLWAEVRLTTSGERLIILLTGRAPFQCLAPLFIFAAMIGLLEYMLIVHWRPNAVMLQTAAHLGMYGDKFDRDATAQPKWFAAGNDLIRADINFTSPPTLSNIQLFQMAADHRLREVVVATSARPIDGGNNWLFQEGQRWKVNPNGSVSSSALDLPISSPNAVEMSFSSAVMPLNVNPIWLRYFGINARYLPDSVFRILADVNFEPRSEYDTWSQARLSIPVGAGGMVVLAGCLSALLLINEVRLSVIFVLVAVGYLAHFFTKLSLILGDYGWISPVVAGWFVPVVVLLCPLGILGYSRKKAAT
jgi:lipopolysaccharide export system permease protein